ncbi:MAG: 5'-nucleotidase C-terminal domain-containing protein [Desulfobulbus sp.]|jgi:5'-nucleotidase|uniref:bifunctional metallophosphatase/5'-nucleotidase n=1 Tax=Desulfobulbus sp. TaxID=895 RepID=UPI00283E7583|nr:5'-nucleotidase C-terminal domain-containing protein [Desulfobulbus sp.]MDR2548653.1 5'-nucleotidase C-terminal domain-containing protein [Desulfobulbus sp.]
MRQAVCTLALILSLALAGCGTAPRPSVVDAAGGSQSFELTVLHINDHHSHLDPEQATLLLDTGHGKREPVNVERGGFARVAGAIKALEKEPAQVLKIHSGDASTGDLYFTLAEGKADADLMETVCFDTFTLGNHEFDNADAGIKKMIGFLRAGKCATPILSANVRFGPSSPMRNAGPGEAVVPSVVLERGGQKIGIVGLTVAGKTKNSSRPDPDTVLLDEATVAQAEIDRLRNQGINKIILATHIGYQADQALVKKLSGVDVVIGGDSHSLLGPEQLKRYGLTPEGPYPTRSSDRDGKPVCIAQAWQYGYVVGEMRVRFDANGEVSDCAGTPWLLVGDQFSRGGQPLNPEEDAAARKDIAASGVLRITPPDPQAEALLAPYAQQKEAMGATRIATATDNLCLRRVPGSKRDPSRSSLGDACNANERVNAHGGDMQQLVAEAFLQQGRTFFNADLSLLNGGGVRIDLRKGPVTVKDVYTVLPFKNTLVQLNATGAEIKAALEDAVEGVAGPAGNTGCYPYAGGLRWQVDLTKPMGARFSHLEIRAADGSYRPLDPKATYKVITISFLADGNDSFTTLKSIVGERRVEVGLDYAEAFLRYIEKLPGGQKELRPLPVKEYSTQRFIDR